MALIQGKQIENINDASIASGAAIALSKLAEPVIQADGGQAFTGDQSMGSNKLTNVTDGTAATDAATKGQLDAALAGLSWKDKARGASSSSIANLSNVTVADPDGDAQGITYVEGDRYLVKDTASSDGIEGVDAKRNGIYIFGAVTTGTAALTRTTDADSAAEVESAAVFIDEGTSADMAFTQTADNVTLETTGLTFVQFNGLGQVTAGTGLSKSGNTLNVGDVNRGVQVNADDLEVDGSEIASTGLEQDATNTWQLRIAAQGNGIAGGGGSTLSVNAKNDSIAVGASGVSAAVNVATDKDLTASVTASDFDQATASTLTSTPGGDAMPQVMINGIQQVVGNGVKTKDCYFSGDSGTTARAIASIVTTDTLHWVGSVAGFELAATDRIDINYPVA